MIKIFSAFLLSSSLIFADTVSLPTQSTELATSWTETKQNNSNPYSRSKMYYFASGSAYVFDAGMIFLPGLGCSYRFGSNSIDAEISSTGTQSTILEIHSISCSYARNVAPLNSNFYCSVGAGGTLREVVWDDLWVTTDTGIIIPGRLGMQWKTGFVDLGAKLEYYPGTSSNVSVFVLPEVRAGFGF